MQGRCAWIGVVMSGGSRPGSVDEFLDFGQYGKYAIIWMGYDDETNDSFICAYHRLNYPKHV